MIDPVGPRSFPNAYWDFANEEIQKNNSEIATGSDTKSNQSAAGVVASLYYQSSISPWQDPSLFASSNDKEAKIEAQQTQKSWFGKTKDWLWNLFGFGTKPPAKAVDSENCTTETIPLMEGPRLEAPDAFENQRMSRAIADINHELVNRLKEIAEFEEELRKSPNNLDKLLFLQLVNCSLFQKSLKEESSFNTHHLVQSLHKTNKALHEDYYDMLEEIHKRARANKNLHWTNIGLTAGLAGALAITFATGGAFAIISSGLSLMTLAKGATTMTEGILKYKNDLKTGELFVINQDMKATNKKMNDEINVMQTIDEEIAGLLKTIRHHLENQSRAERASFGRN